MSVNNKQINPRKLIVAIFVILVTYTIGIYFIWPWRPYYEDLLRAHIRYTVWRWSKKLGEIRDIPANMKLRSEPKYSQCIEQLKRIPVGVTEGWLQQHPEFEYCGEQAYTIEECCFDKKCIAVRVKIKQSRQEGEKKINTVSQPIWYDCWARHFSVSN